MDDVALMQRAAIKRFKAEEKAYEDASKGKKTRLPNIDDDDPQTLNEGHLDTIFKKYTVEEE